MPVSELVAAGNRLTKWVQEDALPFWASVGVDGNGGFWEELDLEGRPRADCLRRVRVQARQCYVYSHAAYLGWFENATEASDHGWSYIITQGMQNDLGSNNKAFLGCAHLLNPDGSLNDGLRDTYAQAFLIIACAWRLKAFKDETALKILNDTVNFLNTRLKAQNGGWYEGLPTSLPRRQNPHMHLFEAFLTAYEATEDRQYLLLSGQVFNLFKEHFFEAETDCLLEFFEDDWSPDKTTGGLIEPGHMLEWCWLLYWYNRYTSEDVSIYAECIYNAGEKLGVNAKTGLVINESSITGEVTDSQSRCWPQTEYIKANIARARFGVMEAEDNAARMIDLLFQYYLDVAVKGGWNDQRDENGDLVSNTMPASTFYHLFCAAAEVDDFMKKK